MKPQPQYETKMTMRKKRKLMVGVVVVMVVVEVVVVVEFVVVRQGFVEDEEGRAEVVEDVDEEECQHGMSGTIEIAPTMSASMKRGKCGCRAIS